MVQASSSPLQPGCVSPPPGARTVRLDRGTTSPEDQEQVEEEEEEEKCLRVCSVLSSNMTELGIFRSGDFTSCWCVEGEIDTRYQ